MPNLGYKLYNIKHEKRENNLQSYFNFLKHPDYDFTDPETQTTDRKSQFFIISVQITFNRLQKRRCFFFRLCVSTASF